MWKPTTCLILRLTEDIPVLHLTGRKRPVNICLKSCGGQNDDYVDRQQGQLTGQARAAGPRRTHVHNCGTHDSWARTHTYTLGCVVENMCWRCSADTARSSCDYQLTPNWCTPTVELFEYYGQFPPVFLQIIHSFHMWFQKSISLVNPTLTDTTYSIWVGHFLWPKAWQKHFTDFWFYYKNITGWWIDSGNLVKHWVKQIFLSSSSHCHTVGRWFLRILWLW